MGFGSSDVDIDNSVGAALSFHYFQVSGSLVYYSLALFLCLKISCSTKLKKEKNKMFALDQKLEPTVIEDNPLEINNDL